MYRFEYGYGGFSVTEDGHGLSLRCIECGQKLVFTTWGDPDEIQRAIDAHLRLHALLRGESSLALAVALCFMVAAWSWTLYVLLRSF